VTALVLGGSGFIGRKLIRRLLLAGEKVVATRRQAAAMPSLPNLAWRQVELAEFQDWDTLLVGVSTVYHLAWSTIPATADIDPAADRDINVVGSIRLLEALKASRKVRLVFVSSGGTVYGRLSHVPARETDPVDPIGVYGLSKLAVERHIAHHSAQHGLDAVVLRFGNPFGSGQLSTRVFGVVSTFCAQAQSGQALRIFGDGTNVRDYFHVEDAVDALLLAAASQSEMRTFNIGSGVGRSLNDVVRVIEGVLGRKLAVQYEPQRSFDVPVSILDVTRAQSELGWQPRISFAEGIAKVLIGGPGDETLP